MTYNMKELGAFMLSQILKHRLIIINIMKYVHKNQQLD
jgi:hypothetical protein